jgi:hypothetical protein
LEETEAWVLEDDVGAVVVEEERAADVEELD